MKMYKAAIYFNCACDVPHCQQMHGRRRRPVTMCSWPGSIEVFIMVASPSCFRALQINDHAALAACRGDLDFIVRQIDKTAIQRLEHVVSTPFKRLSYTEAVEILEDAIKNKKKKFEFQV